MPNVHPRGKMQQLKSSFLTFRFRFDRRSAVVLDSLSPDSFWMSVIASLSSLPEVSVSVFSSRPVVSNSLVGGSFDLLISSSSSFFVSGERSGMFGVSSGWFSRSLFCWHKTTDKANYVEGQGQ